MSESLITCTVDFDRPGKQLGNLAVPMSTNSAGWAKYYLPIAVIRNGEGPTAVLFGGNHGDEYEGPVTLMNLVRTLEPDELQGRIIVLPMLNRPAVQAGTRLSPIDGVNMNRAFPGSRSDTITGMIAHYVSSVVLPLADLVIDIHSGGSSIRFLPSVNMHRVENQDQMNRMLDAGRAWGAPYVYLYEDVAGEGLLPSLAERMGKVTLGTEMGSKSQFGSGILRITSDGVYRVLYHGGVLRSCSIAPPAAEPIVVAGDDPRDYIMAPSSGIFEPFVELEDRIEAGQAVGQMHSIEHPFRTPEPVLAETSGLLMGRRSVPLTTQGECVATVVRPAAASYY